MDKELDRKIMLHARNWLYKKGKEIFSYKSDNWIIVETGSFSPFISFENLKLKACIVRDCYKKDVILVPDYVYGPSAWVIYVKE